MGTIVMRAATGAAGRRRAAALLACGLLVAMGGAAPGAAARQGEADGRSIALAGRSAWAPAEGSLELDLRTEGDVEPLMVQLRIHTPVDSMAELDDSLEGGAGRVLYRMPELPVGFLAAQADGTRRIELSVSATDSGPFTARLRAPGVYPVTITLEDESGEVIDTVRTPVIRLGTPDDPLPAPDVALVVGFAAPPTIEVDGRRPLDEDELERLARLAELLGGGASPPVDLTIAASPDTIDALTASADPRAVAVLDALAGTEGRRTALGVPYVPVDATALADAGLGAFVEPVLGTGRAVIDDRVGPPLETAIWDSAAGIDRASAVLLAELGFEHVLVEAVRTSVGASPATERGLVDAGPVPLPDIDALDAVVVDGQTSTALAARAADRADVGHLALAELILRDDGLESTVAVEIDRVAEDSVLSRLLPLLARPESPVDVGPLDVASLQRRAGRADDEEPSASELVLPGGADGADAEVLSDLAPEVRSAAAGIDTFADLVSGESARADDLRLQIATSLASGIEPDRRRALVAAVNDAVETTFDGVNLTGQTDLNLTSRRGTLPLMVRNDNPFPVEVVLRIRSDRLEFPAGDHFPVVIDDEIARIDVPVEAKATGSVPTFVEIVTADGGVVLDSRRLDVRSTAVSGLGLAISLGALAVLVIWWARTWRRTRRARNGIHDGSAEPA